MVKLLYVKLNVIKINVGIALGKTCHVEELGERAVVIVCLILTLFGYTMHTTNSNILFTDIGLQLGPAL